MKARLDDVPPNFSPDDIKIHATNKRIVNIKRMVRIYGVWDGKKIYAESINNIN
jgi:hypothetical protein